MSNTRALKFNKSLYSRKNINKAVKEYQDVYGRKIAFEVSPNGKYTDVAINLKDRTEANLADEFANYSLFLNIK